VSTASTLFEHLSLSGGERGDRVVFPLLGDEGRNDERRVVAFIDNALLDD
jgi:hypothetical protein